MGRQNLKAELFYDGVWNDLAGQVLIAAPVTITQGLPDDLTLRPAATTLQLDNSADTYRTSNPESPLYSKAGRNTPLRISVGSVVRSVTEASRWSCDSSQDFRRTPKRGKAWTDVSGDGLLARVGRWSEKLRSPMVRQALGLSNLIGLFPFEDGSDSAVLSSALPTAPAATWVGELTLGSNDKPAGATTAIQLGQGAQLSGSFASAAAASGWQVSVAVRLPARPTADPSVWFDVFTLRDSFGRRWAWKVSSIAYSVEVTDLLGNILATNATLNTSSRLDRWIRLRLRVTPTGYEYGWYEQDAVFLVGGSFAWANTPGTVVGWKVNANSVTTDASYSTMLAVNDATVDLFTDYYIIGSFNGYRGETARIRFTRLLDEVGLPYTSTYPSWYTSRAMGVQPAETLLALLTEIATTEDALIFDTPTAIGLTLTVRGTRYRQTPAVTLTPADLPSLPKEIEAAADAQNVVTVSQRDGAESTAEDAIGPLGSAPPPAGIGEQRGNVDVNVADQAALPQLANWWLRRGTVDLPRYPTIEINLAALSPARVAAIESVSVGSVIEIAGFRENTVRLHVLGWRETIGTHSRMITFNCKPDQQFQVGAWDATASRWDSASTTLKTGVNSSATALTFRTVSARELWSQSTPYDVMIAGERVTVTAMGAPALVSGAYDQAATVVRHANGVTKPLPAGAPINVSTPGRWAL